MRSYLSIPFALSLLSGTVDIPSALGQLVNPIDSVITYKRLPPALTYRKSRQWIIQFDSMTVVSPVSLASPPRPLGGFEAIKRKLRFPSDIWFGGTSTVEFTIDSNGTTRGPRRVDGPYDLSTPLIMALCYETQFEPAVSDNRRIDAVVRLRAHISLVFLTEIVETPPLRLSQITLRAFPGLVAGPPDFTLTIDSSGVSTYEGRGGVDLIGSFTGTCPTSSFKRLESLLLYMSFFDAPHTFKEQNLYFARQEITALADDNEVSHWTNEDECNWALGLAIEEVARQIRWTKVQ